LLLFLINEDSYFSSDQGDANSKTTDWIGVQYFSV